MRVIEHVLDGIDNHRPVMEQADESEPIAEIMRSYNRIAIQSLTEPDPDHHLHLVGHHTLGSDFKLWLAYLPPPERWQLLSRYLNLRAPAEEAEPLPMRGRQNRRNRSRRQNDDEADKHNLRHFTIRFALVILFLFMVLVFAAGVTILQNNQMLPDNAVFKAIMELATELAKILFTFK